MKQIPKPNELSVFPRLPLRWFVPLRVLVRTAASLKVETSQRLSLLY